MSTSLQNILSKVQRAFGDESFTRFRRAETIDIIDDAVNAVAATVRMWIEQVVVDTRATAETFTVATVADLTALVATEGDTATVTDEGTRYRYYLSVWEVYPYNVVKIDPAVTQIHKTLQVWKNGVECTEQSLQSINLGYATGYPFPKRTNDVEPSLSGVEYASYRRPDDGTNYVFVKDFEAGDTLTVMYLKERPLTPILWNTAITIPDPVATAIQWKAVAIGQQLLYMQGDDRAGQRAINAEKMAEKELASANSYLRNLLNENSSITIQAIRWLPED